MTPERQRWLVKCLQLAWEDETSDTSRWPDLVRIACEFGASAVPPARPWEFDEVRHVTVSQLFPAETLGQLSSHEPAGK